MTEHAKPRRGPGRPRHDEADDGPGTQERIRLAAREVFAERGYDKTSVRGIAKVAGVDPALVHHYFGSKDDLFAAAIEVTMEPALGVPAIVGRAPTASANGWPGTSSASGRTRPPGPPSSPSSAPPSPTRPRRRSCAG